MMVSATFSYAHSGVGRAVSVSRHAGMRMAVSLRRASASAALALMLGLAMTAGGQTTIEEYVLTPDSALDELQLDEAQLAPVRESLAALPPGGTLEAVCVHVRPLDAHPPFRYLQRLTPRDADGEIEGIEWAFATGPGHVQTRMTPFRAGTRHGVETYRMQRGNHLRAEIPWDEGRIHGVRRVYFEDGTLQAETPHERGVINGETRVYDRQGRILQRATVVDGRRHGEAIDYWPENPDRIWRRIPYREGTVHGTSRAYYLDGTLQWERTFESNRRHGIERHFDGEGNERRVTYWLDDTEVSRDMYEAAAVEPDDGGDQALPATPD